MESFWVGPMGVQVLGQPPAKALYSHVPSFGPTPCIGLGQRSAKAFGWRQRSPQALHSLFKGSVQALQRLYIGSSQALGLRKRL